MKNEGHELYEVRMPGFTADIALNKTTTNYYQSVVSQIGSTRGNTAAIQPAMRNDATCISGDGSMSCDCGGACTASKTKCTCL